MVGTGRGPVPLPLYDMLAFSRIFSQNAQVARVFLIGPT